MSLDQIDNLLARIKVHCPFFMKDYDQDDKKLLKKEWYKVLINYDNSDVNKALDEFLQSNKGSPTVYELVSDLAKNGNKTVTYDDPVIHCPNCGIKLRLKEYAIHHHRHLSIAYLSKMALKYSNINLDKQRLLKMDDSDFNNYYWECCYSLLPKVDNPIEKHLLENSILAHEGNRPHLNLEEIMKNININKK